MSKHESSDKSSEKRRSVVKGVALGVGGLSISQWSKPMVETVVLPAHAVTTGRAVVQDGPAASGGTFVFSG